MRRLVFAATVASVGLLWAADQDATLREAQKQFATYTQEQVDKIFLAAALAARRCGDGKDSAHCHDARKSKCLFHSKKSLKYVIRRYVCYTHTAL